MENRSGRCVACAGTASSSRAKSGSRPSSHAREPRKADMRYFFDTEFYEDGKTIDLISIGIVAEDGREFYAVSQDAQLHRVSDWVRSNVLPRLPAYGDPAWKPRDLS